MQQGHIQQVFKNNSILTIELSLPCKVVSADVENISKQCVSLLDLSCTIL